MPDWNTTMNVDQQVRQTVVLHFLARNGHVDAGEVDKLVSYIVHGPRPAPPAQSAKKPRRR